MRFFLVCILLLFISADSTASSFDESENLSQKYEDFLQEQENTSHRPTDNKEEMGQVYLVYGRQAIDAGEFEKAVSYLKAGQDVLPDDGRFSMMLGFSYSRMANNALAEMHLYEALRLMPDHQETMRLLAHHFYQAGKLPEAKDVLVDLARLNPDDTETGKLLEQVNREMIVEADMTQDVNSNFSIKFDEQLHSALADQVVDFLQDAYAGQGALFNLYPDKTIQVILYTRDDYDMTTGAPPWSAGRFDGKIRIPVNRAQVQDAELKRILEHEYNHFLAQQISRGKAPAWFYEGLAIAAESSASRKWIHIGAAFDKGAVISFSALNKSFSHLDHDSALLAYKQSYSFVNYLVAQFGWHTMVDLLNAFSHATTVEMAFNSVFSNFGLDFENLQVEWLNTL